MTAALLALNARTFASLRRHRNYRLFFTGQVISVSGTWMQNIALAWLVVELTHSPLAVGALAFCRFLPFTIFGLVAGVVADRIDNRKLVITTQSVSMTFSAILAVLVLTGSETLWLVYVLAILSGTALVFDAPGRHALTFQMVGRDELPNAVALNASLFNASRVVGPAVAGVLIAAFGVGVCFLINTITFLAVLAGLLLMRKEELVPLQRSGEPPTMMRGIREGFSWVLGQPQMRLVLLIVAVVSTVGFNFHVLLPLLASDTLDTGAGGVRDPLRLLRRRRARRRAAVGRTRPRELEGARSRHRRLQPLAARPRPDDDGLGVRCAAVHRRHLLHALDVERELDPPAQRAGPPAWASRQPLSVGVRRLRAGRRSPGRLARRSRRHPAQLHRRRSDRARDDAAHGSPAGQHSADGSGYGVDATSGAGELAGVGTVGCMPGSGFAPSSSGVSGR